MRLVGLEQISSIRTEQAVELRPATDDSPAIVLRVHNLPPDYGESVESELPTPVATRAGWEKDEKGRLVQGPDGRPLPKYLTDDGGYRKRLREVQQLQAVKMIVDALVPGQIEFGVRREDEEPMEYYRAIRQEMKEFGFGVGDFVALVTAISDVSGVSEEEVKAATAGFTVAEAEA